MWSGEMRHGGGEAVRSTDRVRWVRYLPGRKEGLEIVRVRVVGASRWRALELVLVLARGTAERESDRLTAFFFSADLSGGFSERGWGLAVDARLRRGFGVWPASRMSGFGGMNGVSLGGDWRGGVVWGNTTFSRGQGSGGVLYGGCGVGKVERGACCV